MKAAKSTSKRFSIIQEALRSCYKERLVSSAVFGSYARNTATPESDLDLLIIACNLPDGRMARCRQFSEAEKIIEKSSLWKGTCLSPVIKTPEEALQGSPLFWDMTDSVLILHDAGAFLEKILEETRRSLEKNGAYRVKRGNAWYWVLKKNYTPGEVFTI